MLTRKDERFIESIASNLQTRLKISKTPNIYNYWDISKFLDNLGYKVIFNSMNNELNSNTILLSFDDPTKIFDEDNYIKMLYQLFYEIWIITKKKANIDMIKHNNTDAKYFARAMLMPEKVFMETVIENMDLKGMCNIFNVAKIFKVEYFDVSARGKDLGCFNPKGK